MDVKVKTVRTDYLIKVNNDIAVVKPSLKEARQHVKAMPINDNIFTVSVIKQTVNETVVDVYQTQTTKVLVASQLDDEL